MSKENNKKKAPKVLWILLAAAAVLVVVLLMLIPSGEEDETAAPGTEAAAVASAAAEESEGGALFLLDEAILVEEIGEYTGIYVEDGSDDPVADLLMMVVTNVTSDPIQYAEITLDLGGETARFTVSVLPSGGSAILIEQSRMAYDPTVDYASAVAECTSLAGFDRELTLMEDKLNIQLLDGGVNIQNISGSDIDETIVLYYKNVANGLYHGGIAYRVRVDGGLKQDEIRQVMVSHIHQPGTQLMFVELVP